MTESNVKIIIEMKKFLEEISTDSTQRAKYIFSEKNFSRKRLLTFQVLVLLLVNSIKRSLSIELMSFFEHISNHVPCSKQAFSKQRRKLKSEFFHDWNLRLMASFYEHYRYCHWKDYRLLAIDGSSVILPQTEEMRNQYGISIGTTTGTGSPVARVCVLYDVLNQLALKGFLHPYNTSEETVVLDVLENENLEKSLLLFDRGYLSYWLIYELLQKNTHFVMRAASNANNEIKKFLSVQNKI